MKNLLALITLIVALTSTSLAQWTGSTFVLGRPSVTTLATDTLGASVTPFAAGQMVCGETANKIMLSTRYPRRTNSSLSVRINWVTLEMDSLCPGDFTLMALRDTAGVGALLTAARGASQFRDAVGDNYIGEVDVSTVATGTWAAGARRTRGSAIWYKDANFNNLAQDRIYWLIIAKGAYTNKSRGVNRVYADMDGK